MYGVLLIITAVVILAADDTQASHLDTVPLTTRPAKVSSSRRRVTTLSHH